MARRIQAFHIRINVGIGLGVASLTYGSGSGLSGNPQHPRRPSLDLTETTMWIGIMWVTVLYSRIS